MLSPFLRSYSGTAPTGPAKGRPNGKLSSGFARFARPPG
jgi:hypothetical protein